MPNRLASASSPYLRMHAGNPVDWQPWDGEALARARENDTPILLSIGYSACHWCHVMAHECFEDPSIATAMNRWFVNIKLDREERPDIDRVYQLAHQALVGRGGGWPLTAFLDPQDLSPFYIGTYFPPVPRHGLPGFPEVLQGVRRHFDSHRGELRAQAGQLRDWMQRMENPASSAIPDADSVAGAAWQRIEARADPEWGGTRGAPKFPRATEFEWLLDRRDATDARRMANLTLATMAARGLQDHLGGGFFRYSVDASWTIPHFEKMLYDNAQLLPAYARLAVDEQADADLRAAANDATGGICNWLARDMAAPDGAFHSAISADSEGAEGRFYLWTREQVRDALPAEIGAVAERAFGLDQPANFEGREWHLLRKTPLPDVARQLGRTVDEVESDYETARRKLFDARERREYPARDGKILTAWNALAISGLARTARMLQDPRHADMALRALAALRDSVWLDGTLFANAAEPAQRIPGFLDDHAFLLDALLETLQLEFDVRDLDWAISIADTLLDKFADRERGGFWFSTAEHATPLARGRDWTDDSLPNGNAVAIRSLLRLGHLIGETRYLDAAEDALGAASGALQRYPDACASLLRALQEFERPRLQIVVRSAETQRNAWQSALRNALHGAGVVPGGDPADAFLIPDEAPTLPGLLAERTSRGGGGTAYICAGLTCQAPVTSPSALVEALAQARS
ncbi:MAG TPA: thioredoxin domain-containing protein [Rhodanobacteraceae bacterium]|nr:thioredoxin domain-containing protein [Rhodanobacteraceae bacterium]